MDKAGIATALTSISAPALQFPVGDDRERQRIQRLVRGFNEFARTMAVDHPGRFGTFATLCLPDVDASLAELAFSFDQLKVDGIVLLTNYNDRHLGDCRSTKRNCGDTVMTRGGPMLDRVPLFDVGCAATVSCTIEAAASGMATVKRLARRNMTHSG